MAPQQGYVADAGSAVVGGVDQPAVSAPVEQELLLYGVVLAAAGPSGDGLSGPG